MKGRWRGLEWLVLTCVLAAAGLTAGAASRSVWDGVYTTAQAADGEVLYSANCASCHGEDLAGIEQAPALAGGAFGEKWKGATLKKLFDRMESMPPTRPKSLSGKEYVELLAYVLSAGGPPAGAAPLEPDGSALADIIFTPVRPQH